MQRLYRGSAVSPSEGCKERGVLWVTKKGYHVLHAYSAPLRPMHLVYALNSLYEPYIMHRYNSPYTFDTNGACLYNSGYAFRLSTIEAGARHVSAQVV